MKVEYINPFIEAIDDTFKTMCSITVERNGDLKISKPGMASTYDLVGVIGLSGAVKGAVMMTMEPAVGRKVVMKFLDDTTVTDSDLMDAFGEILNIISGAAASKLGKVKLALPTVITGKNPEIYSPPSSPWVIIPMKFPEGGEFDVKVAIEESGG